MSDSYGRRGARRHRAGGKVLSGVTVKIAEDGEILVKTARGASKRGRGCLVRTGDLGRFVDGRLEVTIASLIVSNWRTASGSRRGASVRWRLWSVRACVVIARAGWGRPVAVDVTEELEKWRRRRFHVSWRPGRCPVLS